MARDPKKVQLPYHQVPKKGWQFEAKICQKLNSRMQFFFFNSFFLNEEAIKVETIQICNQTVMGKEQKKKGKRKIEKGLI